MLPHVRHKLHKAPKPEGERIPEDTSGDPRNAKRAEIEDMSGNWKRDLGHSLGLGANYFL